MTPAQFLARLKKGAPPATLLLGPEAYERRRIKEALLAAVPAEAGHAARPGRTGTGGSDRRCPRAFAVRQRAADLGDQRRSGLPRGQSRRGGGRRRSGRRRPDRAMPLRWPSTCATPPPGSTLVFEAIRFDFEGDDKRKQDRVRKFYAAIPDVVELRRYSPADARSEAEALVAQGRLPHRSGGAGPAGGSAGRRHRAHRRGDRKAVAVRRAARGRAWTTSPRWCRTRAPPPSSRW